MRMFVSISNKDGSTWSTHSAKLMNKQALLNCKKNPALTSAAKKMIDHFLTTTVPGIDVVDSDNQSPRLISTLTKCKMTIHLSKPYRKATVESLNILATNLEKRYESALIARPVAKTNIAKAPIPEKASGILDRIKIMKNYTKYNDIALSEELALAVLNCESDRNPL